MKKTVFLASLFEESGKRVHKHVEVQKTSTENCMSCLRSQEVGIFQAEKNHMKTEYFIELFERSHQYIDCDCARCKNSRQMAIGIIGTLFRDSKCVSIIKKKEDYSKQELIELFPSTCGYWSANPYLKEIVHPHFGMPIVRQTDGFVSENS